MLQDANKATSIKRGLDFIYRLARTPEGFESYGSLLVCCFALVSATSRDKSIKQLARLRAEKLAQRWARGHPVVPADATPELLLDFIFVRYALSRLGLRDAGLNGQLNSAVKRFTVQDLMGFNPVGEPPPNDLSFACDCGLKNKRGRMICKRCRKRLEIQSRYRVWTRSLSSTYVSERCGIVFGARHADIIKWLPAMRPYPVAPQENVEWLRDAIYAVTHVVYTLNDYSTYRLSPRHLPEEFEFLKNNVVAACERRDPEILGELLDSLKAFGLRPNDPLMRQGMRYLLKEQNEDGSWGDMDEENIRTRCHTTWTAIDGLRAHAWRGERAFPKLA